MPPAWERSGWRIEAALGLNDERPGRLLAQRLRAIDEGRYPPSWSRHWPRLDDAAAE